ncbi:gamma-glutamyltransferase family protein [Caballeronia sp. INDeC2]|uniref:gamma-glutamyltransferase family protein n=1 Tax=Caballeronia sp. INDeC2 TaxID=2921747 RepID=UPI0020280D7E|nr:gamma-glutamyltransferase family protein [Caballeronia sp. INDeC2]
MKTKFDWAFPYPSQKMPLLARNVVTTSQPLAAQAGVRMLLAGGNAVDAALASAITLTVVEPVMNGIGGDLFALVWDKGELHGIDACGRAPALWNPEYFAGRTSMPTLGWDSVTVPGQVAGWAALSGRFGQLPFEKLFEPAIEYAEEGFAISPQIARQWAAQVPNLSSQPGFAAAFTRNGETPKASSWWKFPDQARTLQEIARTKGQSFYTGNLAERICAFSKQCEAALSASDLAGIKVEWVKPISADYRGYTLHEIPPSGQGIAALLGLGILEQFDLELMGLDSPDAYHVMIEAMKLAFADLHTHIGDREHMKHTVEQLLDKAYARQRASLIQRNRAIPATAGTPASGGTVYLAAADASGMMVSFIQSNYKGFGSGVVVPNTGISMHNRGMGFVLSEGHVNRVAPRKKPLHSIIPGFVTRGGEPVMALGVMGGSMQAQGHVQMLARLACFGQNPQAMSDAPRFRVEDGPIVHLEAHTPSDVAETLRARGHEVSVHAPDSMEFGAAQIICCSDSGAYVAASDSRRDGQAVGF